MHENHAGKDVSCIQFGWSIVKINIKLKQNLFDWLIFYLNNKVVVGQSTGYIPSAAENVNEFRELFGWWNEKKIY